MNLEILFSGFGGQGILFISKMLSYTALDCGLNVTWLPSYGPEMRGGTASCSVVISDKKISSPVVLKPKYMVSMNYPSFEKYNGRVLKGGSIFINSDIVKEYKKRDDIRYFDIPIQTVARSISNNVYGNIVMLGSLIKAMNIISIDSLIKSLKKNASSKFNMKDSEIALKRGYDFI